MSWWKFWNKPKVYSPEGQQLYRLLTDESGQWIRQLYYQIQHTRTGITYDYYPSGDFLISVDGYSCNHLLTEDDKNRLLEAGRVLAIKLETSAVTDHKDKSKKRLNDALNNGVQQ